MRQISAILVFFAAAMVLAAPAYAGVTGISSVNIVTDTEFGSSSGKMWVMSWNARDADYVQGTFTKSELQSQSGQEPKQDFSISMNTGDEYAVYNFFEQASYRDVFTVDFISYGDWRAAADAWADQNCESLGSGVNAIYQDVALGAWRNYWCINKQNQDIIGHPTGISSPREIFSTTWTFQPSGKAAVTRTLTNDNVGEASTNIENKVVIKWQGNLETGYNPPEPIGVIGMHDNSFSNGWVITDYNNYVSWDTYIKNTLIYDLQSWANGQLSETTGESKANNLAYAAIAQTGNQQFRNVQITDSTLSGGKFKYDLAEGVSVPNFQLIVNADYLELVIPTGKPQIVSVSSPKFTEDGTGKITAVLKNIGSGRGSFDVRASECTSGFSVVTGIQNLVIDPQATRSQDFVLTGSSTSTTPTITGTCKVYMKETTTGEEVSSTVSVSFDQVNECTPGAQKAVNKGSHWDLCTCNPDGLTENCVSCDDGQGVKLKTDGTYECVDEGGGDSCSVPGSERCDGLKIQTCQLLTSKWTDRVSCDDNNPATVDSCVDSVLPGKKTCEHTQGFSIPFEMLIIIVVIIVAVVVISAALILR